MRLTILSTKHLMNKNGHKILFYECECSCGTLKLIRKQDVDSSKVRSCGCILSESAKKLGKMNTTHGETKTTFYRKYNSIRSRCENPKIQSYKYYGGKGVKCIWRTYKEFKLDMYESYLLHQKTHESTTIERIDVDGDYSKDNCRWVTKKEQYLNKSNTQYILVNGVKRRLHELASEYKLKKTTLRDRLTRGWNVKDALFSIPSPVKLKKRATLALKQGG